MMDDPTTTDPAVAEPTAPTGSEIAPDVPAAQSPSTVAAETTPVTPAISKSNPRGVAILARLGRVARFLVMVALFAGGAGLGYARFQVMQPAPSTAGSVQTSRMQPPPSVQAMIQSLSLNNMDSLRASVAAIRDAQGAVVGDPYRQLVGELQSIGMVEVNQVEELSTFVDGPRTATAFILLGHGAQGNLIRRHLIVQTVSGQIVDFK
jgi:hypothetical protein